MRTMRVETGDFRWKGKAQTMDHALIRAFCAQPPENPGLLTRIHDGYIYHYIETTQALKIAGYSICKEQINNRRKN